jgi:hypothetical protein
MQDKVLTCCNMQITINSHVAIFLKNASPRKIACWILHYCSICSFYKYNVYISHYVICFKICFYSVYIIHVWQLCVLMHVLWPEGLLY